MTRVLVVEDNDKDLNIITKSLSDTGISYIYAKSAREAIRYFDKYYFDLFIIKVELPKVNGFALTRIIREKTNAPIVLTGSTNEEAKKIYGYNLGADDYLVRPFGMLELSCKIRVILNRCKRPAAMNISLIDLNYEDHTVEIGGETIYLSNLEFKLLNELILANGKTVSKVSLVRNVWGNESAASDNTLKERIKSLRKKIGKEHIKSVHGSGYRFVSE